MKPAVPLALCLFAMAGACAQVPPASSQPDDPGRSEAIQRAFADAATRTGVAEARLKAAHVDAVIWRDGSLGCPEPELLYPSVLVPGYRIVVESAGNSLEYHAGQHGQFVYCPPGRARPPLSGPGAH